MLKTILFIAIGYFVWKMIDSAFLKNRETEHSRRNQQGRSGVNIKYQPSEKGHIPDDEGDYIDYQEVK